MILDAMFAELNAIAAGWKGEAVQRRRFTAVDPVADTLDHCAGELESQVAQLRDGAYYLTVEDFARLHDVTTPTVRLWIKRGELRAISTDNGWRIRKEERRKKHA